MLTFTVRRLSVSLGILSLELLAALDSAGDSQEQKDCEDHVYDPGDTVTGNTLNDGGQHGANSAADEEEEVCQSAPD